MRISRKQNRDNLIAVLSCEILDRNYCMFKDKTAIKKPFLKAL
jgi:hypothetical protein